MKHRKADKQKTKRLSSPGLEIKNLEVAKTGDSLSLGNGWYKNLCSVIY